LQNRANYYCTKLTTQSGRRTSLVTTVHIVQVHFH